MSKYKSGDECIARVTETIGGKTTWDFESKIVRCRNCVNWDSEKLGYLADYCPVVRKCTHPNDWCCWGYEKDEEER